MDDMSDISILICDDHRVLTDALSMVIEKDGTLNMVAPPTQDPNEAVDLCGSLHPDVVLMDLRFHGQMRGIQATHDIKVVSPDTQVVIMTAHEDDELLAQAVEAGASGFLGKTEAIDQILSAAKAAAEGEALIDPGTLTRILRKVAEEREVRRQAQERVSELTERELEVLQLLAEGFRNEHIAKKLGISPQTVQTHVRNILPKLGVHSKLEAVAFAVKNGAIQV